MMWRKDSFLKIHYEDELWMDSFGFAYGDDALLSYKLHVNGGKLGVLYDSGVKNLDAGSSSSGFKKSPQRVRVIAEAPLMIWYRSIYHNGADTPWSCFVAIIAFMPKVLWQCLAMLFFSLMTLSPGIIASYCRGLRDGISHSHNEAFSSLPPFIYK